MVATSALVVSTPDYVVFGEDWGIHPSSTQHLARHLAAAHTVLNVSTPGLRRPRLALYDARRVLYKARLWMTNQSAMPVKHGSVNLYAGFAVPAGGSTPVRRLNRHLLGRGVRARMAALGIERPVLFAASPMAAELLGHLGERLVVYYVADDYLALPGIYRRYVGELERALLDRADVIFATSEVLCDAKEGRRGRPVLLPHGVDIAHWTPRVAAAPPPELAALPCPRIGFFGFLAPWVDDRLIVSVARAFPHASVVLIGPAWAGVRAPAAPNITWLGPRSYAELPQYAEHFDVALLPFRRDRLVSAVNPLKLLEYLALGLPVVSTPMALPAALARLVYVAADTEAFVGLVRQTLRDDTPYERSRRRAAAAGESWVARVRTIRDHIDAALAGTMPTAADVMKCSPTLSPGLA